MSLEDDYVLLVGSNGDLYSSKVWHKNVVNSEYGIFGKWAYMPLESYNAYYLPTNVVDMVYYKGLVLAFTDLGDLYISVDGGITWKTHEDSFAFPEGQEIPGKFTVTTDDYFIWYKDVEQGSQSPPMIISSGTRMWSKERYGVVSLWRNKSW